MYVRLRTTYKLVYIYLTSTSTYILYKCTTVLVSLLGQYSRNGNAVLCNYIDFHVTTNFRIH